jgi:hypothetical protein
MRQCFLTQRYETRSERNGETEFRAKDARNAKKLLQGELVEFVYVSLDVTFEELTAKAYQ